jgi:D-glycero-alpha-D-manno-heptose-7-phosphate kinase
MIKNYYNYLIRSRAPLRIGLGGGGTDLPSFFENYGGGCVLNLTLNLHAFCTIKATNNGKIKFNATDIGETFETNITNYIEPKGNLILHKAAYNRIVKDFNQNKPLSSFEMITYSDVPGGSGLGSSSTIMVAIINAYREFLGLPFGKYDLADLAYSIERKDIGLEGGKQDQYAAAFGGVNFMEFHSDGKVIINPLRVKRWILSELEQSLILYFTGKFRDSGKVIEQQASNIKKRTLETMEAMKIIKEETYRMKEGLLKWDINTIKDSMQKSWEAKKASANSISNPEIDRIYQKAVDLGIYCGKISGAGGGGFMTLLVEPSKRMDVIKGLKEEGGYILSGKFSFKGAKSWKVFND